MKMSRLFSAAMALTLLFTISCRNDEPIPEPSKGAYQDGILIANEGGFSTPTSSVDFLTYDFAQTERNIFSTQNDNATLGNVFQSIGFKGDLAYLVLNVPNKIEIVNRYTFKKVKTISTNLEQPRYIAFSGNNTYVTNNNFWDVNKLNIYDGSDTFVKSIEFDKYAEKVVATDGFVYVQTDGVTYDTNYNEIPTGHTVTRVNAATNAVDKTITLTDDGSIKDMVAEGNDIYVLSSDADNSYIYKIAAKTGTLEKTQLTGVAKAAKLAVDNGKIYFITAGKKVYSYNNSAAVPLFDATTSNVYGFNVIDGNVYVSDPFFSKDSTTRIYSLSGNLLKTITTGVGTNGFYKN